MRNMYISIHSIHSFVHSFKKKNQNWQTNYIKKSSEIISNGVYFNLFFYSHNGQKFCFLNTPKISYKKNVFLEESKTLICLKNSISYKTHIERTSNFYMIFSHSKQAKEMEKVATNTNTCSVSPEISFTPVFFPA